ncbi:CidA/LrgA family protein [Acetobacter sp. TBRC 12305]|uniref:CidA/LrgA family protein n=1 Tax=Acetobacter garciniae TaxID=2817435 RepID=A0A939HR83_9PROT|nr:CidA/LrgA family protein [Acetobacter garciniae]MBO1326677.1 CidA/LrgA family protein [Acetobacter garciniae]MBX0345028.1 CidA/LrgA family protein [Acetobacter garciniae]
MPVALLILAGCELLGEVIRAACHLPIPGPVIGMFVLAAALGLRTGLTGQKKTPAPLKPAAETLIANMGLLFVPAGVGIIAQFGLIRHQWLPISAALLGSTVLSLGVTGLVMHKLLLLNHRRLAARAGTIQPHPPADCANRNPLP